MTDPRNNVFRNAAALPKHRVSALLAAGWARTVAAVGKGRFADAAETTTRTIDNGLTGNTLPEAHTVFNSLAADPSALDELLAGYGFRLAPLHANAANDLATSAGLAEVSAVIQRALIDGARCHTETLEVAARLRPHMPALMALIREADEIRGAA